MPQCLLEQPPPTSLHATGASLLSNNRVSLQRERSHTQSDFNWGWKRCLLLPAIWFPDLPSMIRASLSSHFYLLHNAGVYLAPVTAREFLPSQANMLTAVNSTAGVINCVTVSMHGGKSSVLTSQCACTTVVSRSQTLGATFLGQGPFWSNESQFVSCEHRKYSDVSTSPRNPVELLKCF